MTRWAAIAIACSPDEQRRLTVIPAVGGEFLRVVQTVLNLLPLMGFGL